MGAKIGNRAVLLGGSIAALFAARALAEGYEEVVLVDRDELVGVREVRRGAPQGRHINGLLARGSRAMEEMFPEITAELVRDGCPLTDLAGTVRWYFNGVPLQQTRAGLTNVAARRPLMEAHVRERVQAYENVTFMEKHDVLGLVTNDDNSRVIGARVQPRDTEGEEIVLDADLVIDATGRGSRSPVWLTELGYGRVQEDGAKIGLGYASRHYVLKSDPFGKDHSIIVVASPDRPRGAIFTKTDHGTVELTTYGILGDHPPTDPEGFTAFVKTLAAPEIYESIVDAKAIDDPALYKFPTTLRRRYEKFNRFPEGFLIIGDAVCTPNPVFAQAQTLAALEALALLKHMRSGKAPSSLEFMREVGQIIDPAWEMTRGIDLSFPGVEGERSRKLKMMQAYMTRVIIAATQDATVTEAFMRAAGLVDQPQALMKPGLMMRVMRTSNRVLAAAKG
ncbi:MULTISPECIES: NAD(P)/FAD-dependent oxidoreductase [Actinomadura]|uniref:FAD-binding protein n=1 Tax=Actinomadura litoris TaxID=2678616 RepID=A0A7K1LDN4_9ACTN|nr:MULTISPECIES: FAD-binding protein [Actinomadura]MBT2210207.1 FAD-binding protein [Actinomadura sp. NEAU-AAG7]MUN42529.1 FAD-binding protein [Actinomadura litoris]